MKPVLHTFMFREETIDSGSLTAKSSLVHRIPEPGTYRGSVYRGTDKVGCFTLHVEEVVKGTPAAEALPRQVTLDLVTLDKAACPKPEKRQSSFSLKAGGVVVLSVSAGNGGYAVELFRRGEKKENRKVFDSRALDGGDLFVTHVLRPGRYAIRNTQGPAPGSLVVEYPQAGKIRRMMEPVHIECNESALKPQEITIQSVQAVIFSCTEPSRITIELKKPEDRQRPIRSLQVPAPAGGLKKSPEADGTKKILRRIRFYG